MNMTRIMAVVALIVGSGLTPHVARALLRTDPHLLPEATRAAH